ncbi:MAG: type I secretion C-terminal target domain-containing protein, partial [Betaproteobacteria bacterium]|nr:type I secretion C-terminal target domain-containing protein [Betaproteobacteria bacterium]
VITDMNTLASTLAATVAPPTTGQILSGNALGTNWGIGADGGYLESIGVDGYNYTFNPTTGGLTGTGGSYSYNSTSHVLTVNTSQGGILAVDMDNGDYTYQANGTMIGPYTEAIDVALVDHDADQATGTLTLDVARAQGGVGNDVIGGTSASELIIGGGGSDTIDISSGGADTLRWVLGDATGSPTDTVTGFSTANDTLDLRDLLVGELHVGVDPGNLASYLSFNYAGGNTTINVTTHDASSTTQSIVLNGVDLTSNNSMPADQIIQNLLTSGKLITD